MAHRLLQPVMRFVFPGGVLFVAAVGFLRPHGLPAWCQAPVAALPYLALGFGLVFGWYFSNTRILLSLLSLAFASQALTTWPLEKDPAAVSHTVFAAATFLLPLNFLAFSILKEEAIGTLRAAVRLLLFLLQLFVVVWLCEPANQDMASVLKSAPLGLPTAWTPIPQAAFLVFLISGVMHLVRFAIQRHPMDAGASWALAAVFLAYHGTQFGWHPTNFFATAGLIMFVSLVQASYQQTYRDVLTGIPGRLAYEEATAQMGRKFVVAVLAIDQLKTYAGIYGRPVVEQVLKLAAPKAQAACQAGRVFRVSGEELTFLFARQSAVEALVELEAIRKSIESTSLYVRDGQRVWENTRTAASPGGKDQELPVTVSIGVADSAADGATLSMMIKAAYRALYEVKASGGNAVKRGTITAGSVRRSYSHADPVTTGSD